MKRFNIVAIASLSGFLMLSSVSAKISQQVSNQPTPILANNTLSAEKLRQLAQAVTVKVFSNNKGGSGVLISKQGRTYTILTNAHVISTKGTHSIQTPDGKTHNATVISRGDSLSGNDLAVLQFQAQENYQIVTLATNSNLSENQEVLAAGFPDDSKELVITNGKISLVSPQPLIGGYQIGYTNEIRQGMSGGTLLNQEGKLIGINGLHNNAILNETYTYQNGTIPNAEEIQRLKKFSFAVPIQTLAKVAPNLAVIPAEWQKKQQAEKPPVGNTLADKINNIAQKITVRIDFKSKENNQEFNENGSGVIIAKQGNTYYVATARHVFKESYYQHQIITPDGKRYAVKPENIIKSEGTHAVLIKFTSNQSYSVATISKYNRSALDYTNQKPKQFLIFLSGFSAENGKRKLNPGYLQERENFFGHIDSKSTLNNLLNDGYRQNLSYSNLSLRGMSGGPLLDVMGQVIGINGGIDNEIISNTEIGFGYGLSSSSILSLTKKAGINLVVCPDAQNIKDSEINSLWKHPLFAIKKPPANANENELFQYANQIWRIRKYSETVNVLQRILKLDQNSYQAHYAIGLVRSNEEDKREKALDAFEKAIAIKPDHYQAWKFESSVLVGLNRYPEALAAIDKAIEYNDEDFSLYLLKTTILVGLKRYPEALTAIDKAIEIEGFDFSYFIRANIHAVLKDDQAVLADLSQVIKFQPDNPKNYVLRGHVHKKLRDDKAALADYNQAIKLQPDNGNAYYQRGIFYKELKNDQAALADFNQAIKFEAGNAKAYYWRGNVLFGLKKYQEALADSDQAIKLQPDNAENYVLRGIVRKELNKYQEALADYTKAIKLQPDDADNYVLRGILRVTLNDYKTALADYDQAIKLQPNNAVNYVLRGNVHKNLKNYQAALIDYNQTIKFQPNNSNNYVLRGDVSFLLRDYQAVVKDYNQVIKLQPDNANAYYLRGFLRYLLIDYQAALTDLNQAIKLQPNDATNYYWRGSVRRELKDYQAALADCNQVIKLQPNDAKGYYCRGVVYQKQGDDNAALSEYAQALAKNEKLAAANAKIGYIKYERGDVEGAIQEWQKAIQFDSDLTAAQLALAVVLHSRGEQQKALNMAQATLRLDKTLTDVEVLKQHLWGTRLIAEGEKLLSHPNIQALRVKK